GPMVRTNPEPILKVGTNASWTTQRVTIFANQDANWCHGANTKLPTQLPVAESKY
ncbi:hypothetical protein CCACVL1_17829, partial [Corchorus capsularis]